MILDRFWSSWKIQNWICRRRGFIYTSICDAK